MKQYFWYEKNQLYIFSVIKFWFNSLSKLWKNCSSENLPTHEANVRNQKKFIWNIDSLKTFTRFAKISKLEGKIEKGLLLLKKKTRSINQNWPEVHQNLLFYQLPLKFANMFDEPKVHLRTETYSSVQKYWNLLNGILGKYLRL